MLEGLEITIFNKSDILKDNSEFRIDAEYYQKYFLELYKKIQNTPILDELVYMSDLSTNGSFATVASIIHDNNEKTIPFIRSGNVGNTFINKSELEFISKEAHKKLPKSTTNLYDIMMARKGKIGGASIIMEEDTNFNCNENVIKLDIKDKTILNPFYFTVYFNCKFGLRQIERLSTGNVQPWVSIFQIRKLKIPLLSYSFQSEIETLVKNAHSTLEQSKTLYTSAESILLEALDLKTLQAFQTLGELNTNVKSLSSSFLATGRLDAEYYQPKYEFLEEKIKALGSKRLGEICTIKKSIETGSDAYSDNGIPYVRVSNLTKYGISTPDIHISDEYYKKNKSVLDKLKLKKDTILLSKDGSIGIAYKVSEDLEMITSGALLHLNIKDTNVFLADCLALILNSEIVQKQAERDSGGSIIVHWRVSEIENVTIPILPLSLQTSISEKVQESFSLKSESERLLQLAKEAVELAIEKGEEEAMKIINF